MMLSNSICCQAGRTNNGFFFKYKKNVTFSSKVPALTINERLQNLLQFMQGTDVWCFFFFLNYQPIKISKQPWHLSERNALQQGSHYLIFTGGWWSAINVQQYSAAVTALTFSQSVTKSKRAALRGSLVAASRGRFTAQSTRKIGKTQGQLAGGEFPQRLLKVLQCASA